MTTLFKKLNFKNQKEIYCLNAPASFEKELADMASFTNVHLKIEHVKDIDFILTFVSTLKAVEDSIAEIYLKLTTDAVLYFAYPKISSKKYTCEFNRDTGWGALKRLGFETVRLVAIDEDWSAMRFKKSTEIPKRK